MEGVSCEEAKLGPVGSEGNPVCTQVGIRRIVLKS